MGDSGRGWSMNGGRSVLGVGEMGIESVEGVLVILLHQRNIIMHAINHM